MGGLYKGDGEASESFGEKMRLCGEMVYGDE